MKKIDVVIPIFNEEEIIEELILRLQKATHDLNYQFKFILVDDGSEDKTLKKILALQVFEPRLEVIKLSRNWGFQNAYNAGIERSTAHALILMDGDLEDPPELFPEFIKKWEEGNKAYYQGNELGNYQFTSLDDIIAQFQITYVGEDKIISKIKRADVAFHAQRAMQELSFDTFKSCKSQEITVPASLQMILPQD